MGFDRTFCSTLFLWIQRHGWLKPGTRVLLAISGGPDSMAMLHWFQRFRAKYSIEIAVAHLDHQWRPESGSEHQWLSNYCHSQGLRFFSAQISPCPQGSLEAHARQQRYQFMAETMQTEGFSHLATAHTATDQLESMVMRVIRGSIQGLSGIKVERPLGQGGTVIRPLLPVTKSEIETYIQLHQIPCLQDPSNQDERFFRNRIRRQVLPLLRQENPTIETLATDVSGILADENEWLQAQAQELWQQWWIPNQPLKIPVKACLELHPALQRRVICLALEAWQGEWHTFTHRHVDAVRQLLQSSPGKRVMLPHGLVVKHEKAGRLSFLAQ